MRCTAKSVLLLCCLFALLPLSASARPRVGNINVWVVPVGSISATANQSLSTNSVANAVGGMLAARGYHWQRINGGTLQPGTTTLRVLYSVNDLSQPSNVVIAVAASTQLLQTAVIGGGKATVSFYAGLQQSLSQQSTPAAAMQDAQRNFLKELRNRVNAAVDRLESQQ